MGPPLEVGAGEEVLGALQDAEGAVLALLLNVADGVGQAKLVDDVGSSRGKGHVGWIVQRVGRDPLKPAHSTAQERKLRPSTKRSLSLTWGWVR